MQYPTFGESVSMLEKIMRDETKNPYARATIAYEIIPEYGFHQHTFANKSVQLINAKISHKNETEIKSLATAFDEALNTLATHRRNIEKSVFMDMQSVFYAIMYIVEEMTGSDRRELHATYRSCLNEVFSGHYGWQI